MTDDLGVGGSFLLGCDEKITGTHEILRLVRTISGTRTEIQIDNAVQDLSEVRSDTKAILNLLQRAPTEQ